ncbi:ATP-binding protein [Aquabacterium sp. A7-Y]|uniref:hybrid sensor histidine kinase/response regulator n=1 Tax=Aquabacterium sp. A7-Y TaxID=1349605 RepID=UPI00223C93F5|nr:ATP-binding protein [Aquabacterium sp. A7-Y]MCW7536835.1 ATP-binding protein [Aquabacterium sp. A7-Y]
MSLLERRLICLVLFGLLPLALLSFTVLLHSAWNQKRELLGAAGDTMRALVTAVDSELMMSIASLEALAVSPRLAASDFASFHVEAQQLLARRPSWANIVVIDPSVKHLMNVRLPPEAPLPPVVEPASVVQTLRTGQAFVGVLVFNPVIGAHAFSVRFPVHRGGEVACVLTAIVRPDAIREVIKKQQIPASGLVAILDRQYRIVARSTNHEQWVGKLPSPDLLRLLQEGKQSGTARTTTLEGKPVYTVFFRSAITGWSAAVGIPVDALDRPIARSYAALSVSIVVSVLLGLFSAFLIGRTITRPMRELERMAGALGQGEPPCVPHTKLPEIRQVVAAMATAHVEREKLLHSEREARLHAEHANKAKDEFLAMLGHELRNPLAAISAASELLDRDRPGLDTAASREALGIIRRQTLYLGRLTNDLLDAGRVMLGKIMLDRQPLNLADVVQNAVDTLRNTGRLPEQYQLTLSLNPVWVKADSTRIDQIVSNLLNNAVKYTPPPGAITICTHSQDQDAILNVRDTGVGIEADLLPRVFDVFVQGRRSLDRSQGGLGIGLALVRRLVELHGGSVEAKSDGPGKGSEFTLRLPMIEPGNCQWAHTGSCNRSEKRSKIVIVDDNNDFRIALGRMLKGDGHEIHEACDGPSGIETVLRVQPQIALVDIGLPGLDGYHVVQAIRQQLHGRVRLIAMTGYGSPHDVGRGLCAGFDAYLIKPFELDELHRLISDPSPGNSHELRSAPPALPS